MNYLISLPKGVRAREASFKCCRAKGMPMMVMAKRSPKITWVRAIHIPPIRSQIMFIIVERQPVDEEVGTT